jgi:methionyl aminopeptidase
MVHIKTEDQVKLMQEAALLVSKTLTQVATILKPGMSTLDVDQFCMQFVKDHNATLSFYNYHGYPHNICASVNDVVVHGFPNNTPLKEGDIVSIDLGVVDILQLVKVTKESLYKGIEKAIVNNRVGDISFAIQEHTEKIHGYGVVRELVGHGLGKSLHEDPQVPNYGKRGTGLKMKENLVLAIEPMINMGTHKVFTEEDGWTVKTQDGKMSVHFEHDICVKDKEALILSDFSIIEAAEKMNSNLNSSYY